MRIHWGAGVAAAFVLFAAGVMLMVYMSMNQRIDLVTDDYYDKELRHQDRIDEVRRTQEGGSAPAIEAAEGMIRIAFPRTVQRDGIRGEVNFYRPSDRGMDFRTPLQLDSMNMQHLVSTSIPRGKWRIEVRWSIDADWYYYEDTVMVR